MSGYSRYYVTAAFIAGILVTLGFKDLYPDLERRFRRRRSGDFDIDEQEEALGRLVLADHTRRRSSIALRFKIAEGIEGCIGNTPLFKIKSLSEATGCEILAKAEVCSIHLNLAVGSC
jgi:cysteine synthase